MNSAQGTSLPSLSSQGRRYKMRLEFDGSGFCGWQLQDSKVEGDGKHLESVQGVIERAVGTFLRKKPEDRIVVQGCGRTDAGVHAREYFCHFDLPKEDAPANDELLEKMRHSLNCIFPDGLATTHLQQVPAEFHALKNVEKKIYEYRILFRRAKPTLDQKHCWWIPRLLNDSFIEFSEFEKCLKGLEGTHDFKTFMAANSDIATTERTLYWCEAQVQSLGADDQSGKFLNIRFCGNGFLKHQVRNMVGSLMDVAQGNMTREYFLSLFRKDSPVSRTQREEAGYCAPAQGLFLDKVFYAPSGGSA